MNRKDYSSIRAFLDAHIDALQTVSTFLYGIWWHDAIVAHMFMDETLNQQYQQESTLSVCTTEKIRVNIPE